MAFEFKSYCPKITSHNFHNLWWICTLFQIWFSFCRFLQSHEFENYISVGYYVFPLELSVSYSNHVWSLFLSKCCDHFQWNSSFPTQSSPHATPPPLKRNCSPHSIFKKAEKETLSQQICLPQPHLLRAVVIKAIKNAKKRGALMAIEGQ